SKAHFSRIARRPRTSPRRRSSLGGAPRQRSSGPTKSVEFAFQSIEVSMEIEPFSLSRQIEQIDERYRVWQAALVEGAALVDPFRGETLPGKSTYDAAQHLPADDLIREGLLPWLHRLIDLRIQVPWTLLDADLEYLTLQPLS